MVLSKFLVAATLTILFGAIPEYLGASIAAGPGSRLALGLLAGALAASVIYNALFVMLSVLTTRAIAIGLLYLLVWEGLLANLVPGVGLLSASQYSLSIANAIAHNKALHAHLDRDDGGRDGADRDRRRAGDLHQEAVDVLDPGRRGLSGRAARPGGLPRGAGVGHERRAVAGDDDRGHGQDPGPADGQRLLVAAQRVDGRAARPPTRRACRRAPRPAWRPGW